MGVIMTIFLYILAFNRQKSCNDRAISSQLLDQLPVVSEKFHNSLTPASLTVNVFWHLHCFYERKPTIFELSDILKTIQLIINQENNKDILYHKGHRKHLNHLNLRG